MPRISVDAVSSVEDLDVVMRIWAAANRTGPRPAGPQRSSRVRERLGRAELVLLATYGERPAGMALAEEFRDDAVDPAQDAGTRAPTGHIAMVAVDPALWGSGIGTRIVRELQSRHWERLSVWVRPEARRVLRLFTGCDFVDSGRRSTLQDGEELHQLLWTR